MMNKKQMGNFYKSQITEDFFPYWMKFIDERYGGILNCINNTGEAVLCTDKYTWSQGRWLWILGKIHELAKAEKMDNVPISQIEGWMEGTWDFLCNYAIDDNHICCYVLTREGNRKLDERSGRYDASIYADCFALIGMSQHAKALQKRELVPIVESLYHSIVARIESGDFPTEPYPIPAGYSIHGIPMILVNMVYEYILMRQSFGLEVMDEIHYAKGKAEFILKDLCDSRGTIIEHKSKEEQADSYLLNRHRNPGHTLEDLWFLLEFFELIGGLDSYLSQIAEIAKKTFRLGWDEVYGGLFRFVDCEGGKPKGIPAQSAYEELIENTWDMKLWWPHSEILYLFPKLYEMTGDSEFLELYEKSFTYGFTTFPNPIVGEWIQIRTRDGSPEEKLVALPVKDPFHIMRNFIKLVELCL